MIILQGLALIVLYFIIRDIHFLVVSVILFKGLNKLKEKGLNDLKSKFEDAKMDSKE